MNTPDIDPLEAVLGQYAGAGEHFDAGHKQLAAHLSHVRESIVATDAFDACEEHDPSWNYPEDKAGDLELK